MSVKTAVILAAGMGSRLQDITKNEVPKGLFKIEGKSLIERSVEKLRCLGIEKIYIVTGYLSELYEEFAKDKSYIHIFKNRKYKATGSMTSLAILENELKEDFILLESDILYEVYGLIKTINFEGQDCVLLSGKTNSGDECYVEVRDDNLYKITKIRTDIEEIYGELVGISKISLNLYREMIKAYRSKVSDVYYDNNLVEEIRKYDYENAIFDAAKKRKVGYLKIDNLVWGEIDDKNQLERVEKLVLPRLEKISV